MFGYVKTDLPNMYVKDTVLYKAMYCGLCKGIGKCCGQNGRLALNYDLAFLSLLLHNLLDVDVKVEKQRCIIHHVRKRPVAIPDNLTERIACLNVILAYYKLSDDVIDDGKGRLKRSFFNKAYKRAKKLEPELDNIVKTRYAELIEYEKSNGDSIDCSADPFGNMLKDVVKVLMGENCSETLLTLAYNLGKWIYLIDALDDFDKDYKNKNFNVFINSNPSVNTKAQLIMEKQGELVYVFSSILGDVANLSRQLEYKFNHDLIDNILLYGLREQTKKVMENTK